MRDLINLFEEQRLTDEEIHMLCKKYDIKRYTINEEDQSIDVNEPVYFNGIDAIPLKFNEVKDEFSCTDGPITSLQGAPKVVRGTFRCYNINITSLEHAPRTVTGSFICWNTNITSLQGAPEKVGENFYCAKNSHLTSLQGAPKSVGGDFNCSDTGITSLEHAPRTIHGAFYCSRTKLTSLEHMPYCENWIQITNVPSLHPMEYWHLMMYPIERLNLDRKIMDIFEMYPGYHTDTKKQRQIMLALNALGRQNNA